MIYKKITCIFCAFLLSLLWTCINSGTAFADAQILPTNLLTIDANAFYGDSSLEEIVVPEGMETIGEKAFAYSGLKHIYLPETVSSIAKNAFLGCDGLTIYCPANSYARSFADEHSIAWLDISGYASVIEKYREAYVSGNANATYNNEAYAYHNNISPFIGYSAHVGYTYKNLDNDKIPELIIAGIDAREAYNQELFDIYTIISGQLKKIATSYYRSRNYLRSDNTILNTGSNGAGHTIWSLHRLIEGKYQTFEAVFYYYDQESQRIGYYYQTENITFYPEDSDIQLDKATFDAMRDEYESTVYLPPLIFIA
ncbi:MAG: leucine-rich repeat domain-containing protein [Oscillospiraceae bacterium]|nr:leucine-rich repeat domain-containing protein [Oscillospiraceae bacterium]